MKLKSIPEDFIVEEISKIPEKGEGPFHYFKLKKTNYDWFKVQERLADFFRCSQKDIGFAGIKDKHAITTQIISIKTKNPQAEFRSKDIELEYLHSGKEPIHKGNLEGNKFTITVRDCKKTPEKRDWIINYFDDQRFSRNNVKIGLHLLKKEYKQASELIDEAKVHEELQKRPNDYVNAIKQIPHSLLKFYAHSVQSKLWNEYVSSLFEGKKIETVEGDLNIPLKKPTEVEIPLIGFDEDVDESYEKLAMKYGLTPRSFVNPQITALTCEGGKRDVVKPMEDIEIGELKEDSCVISFTLEKGCYATMVIKQLFCD